MLELDLRKKTKHRKNVIPFKADFGKVRIVHCCHLDTVAAAPEIYSLRMCLYLQPKVKSDVECLASPPFFSGFSLLQCRHSVPHCLTPP